MKGAFPGQSAKAGCRWPCICVRGGRFHTVPDKGEDSAQRQPEEQRPEPPSTLFLKVGPDAIVTLQSRADDKPLTWTGPLERTLDEEALDLSSLEVRCKAKPASRSGRKPKPR